MTGKASEPMEFDYVIVGAGSAGCVLANRLSSDPGVRVLLLEAGGPDRDPLIHVPLGFGKLLAARRHDWGYDTVEEPGLNDRRIELARGKVLGGSSSINAMAYDRGNRGDFDRWARQGLDGWAFVDVLPYFKRAESWQGGASSHRGGDGPLKVCVTGKYDPMYEAWLEAARAAGYPIMDDYNIPDREGFARMQSTLDRGRRCSAAVAYLHPAVVRRNLVVRTRALVARVLLEGSKAIGVEYIRDRRMLRAYAAAEVLIAGGSINSPQVMMLSGIGPANHLHTVGLSASVDLPGVGSNLQDHLSVALSWVRRTPGPIRDQLRMDRVYFNMIRAYLTGTGPAADLPSGLMAFIRTRDGLKVPDIQLLFRGVPFHATPWFPLLKPPWQDGFACRPVLLHPRSRGTVRLLSSDPMDAVQVQQNFLSEAEDMETIRAGFRAVREVAAQAPLDRYRGEELAPGTWATTDLQIDEYIRRTASTAHHPASTCRMGVDRDAVVDAALRVHGVEALRVVDASVMPDLVSGNINAAVIMIAEKAADMILGRVPPSPDNSVDDVVRKVGNQTGEGVL